VPVVVATGVDRSCRDAPAPSPWIIDVHVPGSARPVRGGCHAALVEGRRRCRRRGRHGLGVLGARPQATEPSPSRCRGPVAQLGRCTRGAALRWVRRSWGR